MGARPGVTPRWGHEARASTAGTDGSARRRVTATPMLLAAHAHRAQQAEPPERAQVAEAFGLKDGLVENIVRYGHAHLAAQLRPG